MKNSINLQKMSLADLKELREAVSQELFKRFGFEAKPIPLLTVATELQESLDRHSRLERDAFDKMDAVRDQQLKKYHQDLENCKYPKR